MTVEGLDTTQSYFSKDFYEQEQYYNDTELNSINQLNHSDYDDDEVIYAEIPTPNMVKRNDYSSKKNIQDDATECMFSPTTESIDAEWMSYEMELQKEEDNNYVSSSKSSLREITAHEDHKEYLMKADAKFEDLYEPQSKLESTSSGRRKGIYSRYKARREFKANTDEYKSQEYETIDLRDAYKFNLHEIDSDEKETSSTTSTDSLLHASTKDMKNDDSVNPFTKSSIVRKSLDDELTAMGWKIAFTADRQPYFYHKLTRKSSWLIPSEMEVQEENLSKISESSSTIGSPWRQAFTEDKKPYYYNIETRETSWIRPENLSVSKANNISEEVKTKSIGCQTKKMEVDKDLNQLFCMFCGQLVEAKDLSIHTLDCSKFNEASMKSSDTISYARSVSSLMHAQRKSKSEKVHLVSSRLKTQTENFQAEIVATAPLHKPTIVSESIVEPISEERVVERSQRMDPSLNEQCRHCGRVFKRGRCAGHEQVCRKVFFGEVEGFTSKANYRNMFQNEKMQKNTLLFPDQPRKKKTSSKRNSLLTSFNDHQSSLVKCPHCERKFAPSGAEQHIEICRKVENRPKTKPSTVWNDYAVAS